MSTDVTATFDEKTYRLKDGVDVNELEGQILRAVTLEAEFVTILPIGYDSVSILVTPLTHVRIETTTTDDVRAGSADTFGRMAVEPEEWNFDF